MLYFHRHPLSVSVNPADNAGFAQSPASSFVPAAGNFSFQVPALLCVLSLLMAIKPPKMALPDQLKGESLQVFRLGNGGDDRVVQALRVRSHSTQHPSGIERRGQDHVLEQRRVHMV